MVTGTSEGTQDDSSKSAVCTVPANPDLVGQVSLLMVPQNVTYLGQILEPHLGFCLISQNKK